MFVFCCLRVVCGGVVCLWLSCDLCVCVCFLVGSCIGFNFVLRMRLLSLCVVVVCEYCRSTSYVRVSE